MADTNSISKDHLSEKVRMFDEIQDQMKNIN